MKNALFGTGVIMFLIGAACLDSNLFVGSIVAILGVVLSLATDKLLN